MKSLEFYSIGRMHGQNLTLKKGRRFSRHQFHVIELPLVIITVVLRLFCLV